MHPADISRLLGIVPGPTKPTASDIIVLAHITKHERYVWIYTEAKTSQALCSIGSFAANPELDFTWHDAAVLSQAVRRHEDTKCQGKKKGKRKP